MESGGTYYQDMDRLAAFEKGLRTWANWVDANLYNTGTRVFFQSISPTHYKYVTRSLSFFFCFFSLNIVSFFGHWWQSIYAPLLCWGAVLGYCGSKH